jgi:hypothetical protein
MFNIVKFSTLNLIIWGLIISFGNAQDDADYSKLFKSYYNNGQLKSGKLKKPKMVQDYPCTGKVAFNEKGYISEFTLSKDHKINGIMVPAGSRIEIQINQKKIYFSKDTEVNGFWVKAGSGNNGYCIISDEGKLLYFIPKENIVIDKIPCKAEEETRLFPDGKIWVCTLSENVEVNSQQFTVGTTLLFDEHGMAKIYSDELFQKMRRRLAQ